MNKMKLTYSFKCESEYFPIFEAVVRAVSQATLNKLWTEKVLESLTEKDQRKFVYKELDEANVETKGRYVPSRIRRGILEQVGRILRSQTVRRKCFYQCIRVYLQEPGESLGKLVRAVAYSSPTYYTYAMIRQTLRLVRKLDGQGNDPMQSQTFSLVVRSLNHLTNDI